MPRIIGSRSADPSENKVLKACIDQFPNDWVVLPNVKWSIVKNGYVRDGEADFVVLVPRSGMVILEVKGSKELKVKNITERDIWYRKEYYGWHELKESPAEQACRNMHDLKGFLEDSYDWEYFPGRFAYIVVYPQGKAETLPAMFDESTLATFRNMNQLSSRIRNALDKRGPEGRGNTFTESVVEQIIDHLKNRKFSIQKVDTGDDVAEEIKNIEKLTRQQFASLQGLFNLPNVAIIGPAGSGKTILALWRLKALIDEERNAIYVCYNRALAEWIKLNNADYADYVWNVDKLFTALSNERNRGSDLNVYYREILPGSIMDNVDSLEKYDSIIIDEGQDFSEEQIIALTDLLKEESYWSFFADWKQDLYGAGKGKPIHSDVVFHLCHNCRNTIEINKASNRYLNYRVESMPGMPKGVEPLVEVTRSQSKRAWELAKQWSGEGAVVILSPYRLDKSSMANEKSGHGLTLADDIKKLGAKDTVYFSTIKSFKGMEAATVIVVDVSIPNETPGFSQDDLYVACTRATARLALLSNNKEVLQYFG